MRDGKNVFILFPDIFLLASPDAALSLDLAFRRVGFRGLVVDPLRALYLARSHRSQLVLFSSDAPPLLVSAGMPHNDRLPCTPFSFFLHYLLVFFLAFFFSRSDLFFVFLLPTEVSYCVGHLSFSRPARRVPFVRVPRRLDGCETILGLAIVPTLSAPHPLVLRWSFRFLCHSRIRLPPFRISSCTFPPPLLVAVAGPFPVLVAALALFCSLSSILLSCTSPAPLVYLSIGIRI